MTTTATYGVDLAAQPTKTAVCAIEWSKDGHGRVDCPRLGADDAEIVSRLADDAITVAAIDAPFGWPSTFIESVAAYHHSGEWPDAPGERMQQELMRLRATDRSVHAETKLTPLSVSTDKIGASRCAARACSRPTGNRRPKGLTDQAAVVSLRSIPPRLSFSGGSARGLA